MHFLRPKSWRVAARVAILGVLGAGAGLAYWWYVGCETGGCPITSNPFLTAGFGAAFGLTLGWPSDGMFRRQEPGSA